MQNIKKELKYMNVAKAIGIILIIIGHSFSQESLSPIRSFVYLFHVPFFFIISGYFFNVKYIENPIILIKKRIKSLWLPFFLWSILFILLHNIFFNIFVYSDEISFSGFFVPYYSIFTILKNIIKSFLFLETEQLLGGFWFLPCLFFTTVLFLLFNIFSAGSKQKHPLILLCISSFVFGILLFKFDINIPYLPYKINLYLITTFLFYIGFLYRKYENLIPMRLSLFIISLVILSIINILNLTKIDSIYSVVGSFTKSIFYLIFTPLLGTYIIIYLSKKIANYKISLLFEYIGKNTISILALHFLCFKLVSLLIAAIYNLDYASIANFPVIPNKESWFILYSISGLMIPIALQFFLDKLKKLIFIYSE